MRVGGQNAQGWGPEGELKRPRAAEGLPRPLALFLAEPRTLLRHLPPPRRLALIGAAALAAFSLGAYQFLLFNLTREAESLQPFFDALGSGGLSRPEARSR